MQDIGEVLQGVRRAEGGGGSRGSALRPFLLAMRMNRTDEIREESPWTAVFADDIVVSSESREQVEENLEVEVDGPWKGEV